MVITDCRLCIGDLNNRLKELYQSGVKAVQLREKSSPASSILEFAVKANISAVKYDSQLIINDRLDIALLSGCSAVHSPAKGIPNKEIKKYIKNSISGKSVHSIAEAVQAEKAGYDYLLFGPVFRTPAKIKFGKPQGLDKLKKVCCAVKIPVFAVGGINPSRVPKCLKAGAYGVAGIREFMTTNNIKATVSNYSKVLGGL
ncbi:MAG: thiamine phosphate synthase [Ignavibacteria bacterium]|nr:thiamine phosphate synthase [Ignavibacteria bacterium]